MKPSDNRMQKIQALQEAMSGNAEPLRQLQRGRGRVFTTQELEQRRLYLCAFFEREVDLAESISFLGRYDKSAVPGKVGIGFGNGVYAWLS